MAIEKISRVNSITAPTSMSNVASASKNLQSQLLIKQQNLKKLSTNADLSTEEKEKQRRELQKEIEELKRKLEQMRLKQEETEKAKEAKEQLKAIGDTNADRTVKNWERANLIAFVGKQGKIYIYRKLTAKETQQKQKLSLKQLVEVRGCR